MEHLTIIQQSPCALEYRANNPRTHSPKQIRQIADSIRRFGFTNPVLVDRNNRIMAGHGRVAAARQLGLETIPTVRFEDMTEDEVRAYVIADNKLAENAGWDRNLLALELQHLTEVDLDFDVTITGFEPPEIDILLGELTTGENEDPADIHPVAGDGPAITRPGDLWQIGKHRLLCGDAMDSAPYDRLLDGDLADMVFTDPPYNVPIDGHVTGLGRNKHREFAMASGEMSEEAFTAFLLTVFSQLAAVSRSGAIHYICMDWRHMGEVIAAGKNGYSELKNVCVWAKTNGGMGSLYRSQHELIFVFKSGTGQHINNVELGKHGRHRTNLWSYAGINSFGENRDADLAMHPTVKPTAMVADAILDCSRRKGRVLDSFAGSGTTIVACERTGRTGYGIEIDPLYCDVILRRMLATFGIDAIRGATGERFADLADEFGVADAGHSTPAVGGRS